VHDPVLALGGGCRVHHQRRRLERAAGRPEHAQPGRGRQCAAWWQKITQARTQDAWRATKKLYEAACRKPLARAPGG
jgi:hypothetical protein